MVRCWADSVSVIELPHMALWMCWTCRRMSGIDLLSRPWSCRLLFAVHQRPSQAHSILVNPVRTSQRRGRRGRRLLTCGILGVAEGEMKRVRPCTFRSFQFHRHLLALDSLVLSPATSPAFCRTTKLVSDEHERLRHQPTNDGMPSIPPPSTRRRRPCATNLARTTQGKRTAQPQLTTPAA